MGLGTDNKLGEFAGLVRILNVVIRVTGKWEAIGSFIVFILFTKA